MAYNTIPLEVSNANQRKGLLKLWSENMSDPRIADVAADRMRWFYEENPLRSPSTFISLYGEQGEIVGCGSAVPRRMLVEGKTLEAGILCDFAVARKHRLGGAAMAIQRALQQNSRATGQGFLFGFPNKASLPVVKRVGYQVVADARAWVKPLRSVYKLGQYLKNPLLARAAAPIVDFALAAFGMVRVPPRPDLWTVETVERADASFDGCWAGASGYQKLLSEKTSAFLNWRYADFKTKRCRFFVLRERASGSVAAFLVYAIEDNKVFIVDLVSPDLDDTLAQLLVRFSGRMRHERHVSIYFGYAGNPILGQRLERLGFFRSSDPARSLVVYVDKDMPKPLSSAVLDRNNWLMFDGEMDI